MSEIDQLKKRIIDSGENGVETSYIHDDYEPIGKMMIRQLVESGEYVTCRAPFQSIDSKWRIFLLENEPK